MNEADIRTKIVADKAASGGKTLIYLEGDTDPPMFFGLLGVQPLESQKLFFHNGTGVKGLGGSTKVKEFVRIARRDNLSDVFGIVDGDGAELACLASAFDTPFLGPVFWWKAYCIESFFPRTSWCPAWGREPNWTVDLAPYAAYVALNRMSTRIQEALKTAGLSGYRRPQLGQLLTQTEILPLLATAKSSILGADLEREFLQDQTLFLDTLNRSLEGALAMLNGKWLFDHFLPTRGQHTPDFWRKEWITQATASGGLPEVRDLWQRITGSPP
jgi:hypothetical protein